MPFETEVEATQAGWRNQVEPEYRPEKGPIHDLSQETRHEVDELLTLVAVANAPVHQDRGVDVDLRTNAQRGPRCDRIGYVCQIAALLSRFDGLLRIWPGGYSFAL